LTDTNNSTDTDIKSNTSCPLCKHESSVFYHFKSRLYHICNHCSGIFPDRTLWPNFNDEKARYEEHNNDVEDLGYQKFVSPIVSAVHKNYTESDAGLDFGAGPGPVISKMLKDLNYNIKLYDPFFHKDEKLLLDTYNYIVCCEVMEHFHHPYQEFQLMRDMLKADGAIYCLTDIYDDSIDFHKWYYKNDQTHVFIYQKETLEWIKNEFQFPKMEINKRLISFSI